MFRSLVKLVPKFNNGGALVLSRFASSTPTSTFPISHSLMARSSIIGNTTSPIIQQLYMNKLVNFQPTQPKEYNLDTIDEDDDSNTMHALSVLRKRRLKMKKHKYKKRRKAQRALRKRLGK